MWSARMIAAFNGRDRQEKVDRSRHASEIGGGLDRGAGHESRKAGRCSWKTLLLSDAAFHGSTVTRHDAQLRGIGRAPEGFPRRGRPRV